VSCTTFVFLRPTRFRLTSSQYPETATFLTDDERRFVLQTLREDSFGQATHFNMVFVWQALSDWKTYMQVLNLIGCVLIIVFIDMAHLVTCKSQSLNSRLCCCPLYTYYHL
jgi:hypothetical protein